MCETNNYDDPTEALGAWDATLDLSNPDVGPVASGFFSLNGRSMVVTFGEYAPLEKGDTLAIHEPDFNGGFDAEQDSYDVVLLVYDAAEGESTWVPLFVGAEGYRELIVGWWFVASPLQISLLLHERSSIVVPGIRTFGRSEYENGICCGACCSIADGFACCG